MILLSQTDRSFIAHLQPSQTIAYIDRNGQRHTVQADPGRQASPWLHLFNRDRIITPAWFGDSSRLAQNLHSSSRAPIENAVADLLRTPGHVALIIWSPQQRRDRAGQPYGNQLWLPAGYRLVPYEPELQETANAL